MESIYGFEVDEVRTLNMDGKRKKRGGLLIAKPDYKKAYVTLRNPLSINPDLYPIRVIEEDKKNMSKQSKSTIVEGDETTKTHWLDGSGVKKPTGYGGRVRHVPADRRGSGSTSSTAATSKFPWTNMRSTAR